MTTTSPAEPAHPRPPGVGGNAAGGAVIQAAIQAFQSHSEREASFRLLFDAYYPPLVRFFARKGLSREDCHDLTQETFLGIYKGLDGYRREARFETWLYRIAMTTYLRRVRAKRTAMRSGDEVSTEATGIEAALQSPPDQLGSVLDDEERRRLTQAVGALPDQMRKALILRIHRQLSYQEIATVMRISIQTVKAHLFQARKRLRERLGDASLGEIPV